MRIMVTGGTSYVVRRLTEEGHEITVLARNPAKVKPRNSPAGTETAGQRPHSWLPR